MDITEQQVAAANAAGLKQQARLLFAVAARYDHARGQLEISLNNGLTLSFDPKLAQGLETACPGDLSEIEISPSGLGLHFPAVDADLYLPGVLEGLFGSRNWMAARMGQAGGRAKSDAKAEAARTNGRKGGRPRKSPARVQEETINK